MKYLFIALMALGFFCSHASLANTADPSALMLPQGDYSFSGLQTFVVKHFEVVRMADADRLKVLRAQKYQCSLVAGQAYQCSKFDKGAEMPELLRKKIVDEMRDYSLNFDKPMESPQLENDAEYLQEWKVVQKITRGEEVYKYYRYQILQGPLHKITPTSADGVMESMTWLVDSTEQLREPREYRVREGINCWTLYNMGLVLRKK